MKVDCALLVRKARKAGVKRFVVGAVITRGRKVLLLKRKKKSFLGGVFEFPGGKVEANETLLDALRREVWEETGLKTRKVVSYLSFFDYAAKNGEKTRQFNFKVSVEGTRRIKLTEHDSFAWVGLRDLLEIPASDNVKRVLKRVLERGKQES